MPDPQPVSASISVEACASSFYWVCSLRSLTSTLWLEDTRALVDEVVVPDFLSCSFDKGWEAHDSAAVGSW